MLPSQTRAATSVGLSGSHNTARIVVSRLPEQAHGVPTSLAPPLASRSVPLVQPRQQQQQAGPGSDGPQQQRQLSSSRSQQEQQQQLSSQQQQRRQEAWPGSDRPLQQQPPQQRPPQHQAVQPPAAGYPRGSILVVVEGKADMHAVRRAAPGTDIFVLGTATVADSPRVLQELEAAAARYPGGVLVLTDPDVAGRQARRALDDRLPGRCLHAFLPTPLATAHTATRWHEAGNVGVEHAVPGAIRAALAAPRRSDPSRQAFDRADLLRWRLAAELHVRGGDVTARRTAVCAYLGLGACDGKQLLRQLNCYGFTHQEVAVALEWAERQLQTQHTSDGSTPPKGA